MPSLSRSNSLYMLPLGLALCLMGPPAAAEEDPLPPEQAFRFSARVVGAGQVEVRYRLADGYYL